MMFCENALNYMITASTFNRLSLIPSQLLKRLKTTKVVKAEKGESLYKASPKLGLTLSASHSWCACSKFKPEHAKQFAMAFKKEPFVSLLDHCSYHLSLFLISFL